MVTTETCESTRQYVVLWNKNIYY